MIDLRSDTTTLPTEAMLETILKAPMGDDGRIHENGRGEDSTANELEDLAARLTGKEAACIHPSGTFGNTASILAICRPGDKVLVDYQQHIYRTEKVVFDPRVGQLIPVLYRLNDRSTPDVEDIRRLIRGNDIRMLCVENTHNYAGGVCTTPEELAKLREVVISKNIHLHMDGARLFNAAVKLGISARELCASVDSVMFCISKGLGAPIGSIVCGSRDFIRKVRETRKLLGGGMRQVGVIAAPGYYALQHNIDRLREDHENAATFADEIVQSDKISLQRETVQTNIVIIDISKTGQKADQLTTALQDRGLKCSIIDDSHIRAVFHLGVSREDTTEAVRIFKSYLECI